MSSAELSVFIRAIGVRTPERTLTNAELSKMVDTSDEWIQTRSGISERRIAGPGENPSDLGAQAAAQALQRAGLTPADVDLLIVATMTPDVPFPSTACLLQAYAATSPASTSPPPAPASSTPSRSPRT
jgi:3-oxoacyl-[acyl-carrier-protein] synthase-3